jgi:hypothetical protein
VSVSLWVCVCVRPPGNNFGGIMLCYLLFLYLDKYFLFLKIRHIFATPSLFPCGMCS